MGFWEQLTGSEQAYKAKRDADRAAAAQSQEQQKQIDAGLQAYMDYMNKALAVQQQATGQNIMAQAGYAQAADLIQRQAANAAQNQALPYQTAQLSALQALPILQQMAGVQAYALPQTVTQYDWMTGMPDYRQMATEALNYQAPAGNPPVEQTATGTVHDAGMMKVPPGTTPSASQVATAPQAAYQMPQMASTQTTLQPTTPQYSVQASPLYQFQKQELEQNMNRQLRAKGLSGSETGALLTGREMEKLSAEEAEKQYGRVMDLVKIGMGGAESAGRQTAATGSALAGSVGAAGQDVGNALNQAAQARSGLYQNIGQEQANAATAKGATTAQMYSNMASNVRQPALWQQVLPTALSMYGGWAGGQAAGKSTSLSNWIRSF